MIPPPLIHAKCWQDHKLEDVFLKFLAAINSELIYISMFVHHIGDLNMSKTR